MKAFQKIGLIITLMVVSLIPGLSESGLSFSVKGSKPIIIRQLPPDPVGAPRSPESTLFFAEVMNGYVMLGASTSCGIVYVEIISTAGDDYSTYFDTSDGAILLPISGSAGDYTLSITTPDGHLFVGEFSI